MYRCNEHGLHMTKRCPTCGCQDKDEYSYLIDKIAVLETQIVELRELVEHLKNVMKNSAP